MTAAFLEEMNCGSFILKDALFFWQQKTDLFDYIADCDIAYVKWQFSVSVS